MRSSSIRVAEMPQATPRLLTLAEFSEMLGLKRSQTHEFIRQRFGAHPEESPVVYLSPRVMRIRLDRWMAWLDKYGMERPPRSPEELRRLENLRNRRGRPFGSRLPTPADPFP